MSFAGFCVKCGVPYYEADRLAHQHKDEPEGRAESAAEQRLGCRKCDSGIEHMACELYDKTAAAQPVATNPPKDFIRQQCVNFLSPNPYPSCDELAIFIESLGPFFTQVSQPPTDKRAEIAFDKLADGGFFEDVKDWPLESRNECVEILRELAAPVAPVSGNGTEPLRAKRGTKMEIRTENINPPIPIRQYDWRAWIDGREEAGPFGYGATEAEAIASLKSCEFCGDSNGKCEHGNCLSCGECETCHDEGESLSIVNEE